MRGTLAVWAASLLLLTASSAQAARMDTVRITITGGDLAAPVEITDSAVTRGFEVWKGPGNFKRVGEADVPIVFAQGFIVDWSQGVVEPPRALKVYEVSFLTTRHDHNTYVVRYMFDPSTNHGYVYIPGKGEPAYTDNTWMNLRGIEGHWFHAWSKWDEIAQPLIANAVKAH